jgi:hypothetical protein
MHFDATFDSLLQFDDGAVQVQEIRWRIPDVINIPVFEKIARIGSLTIRTKNKGILGTSARIPE